MPPQACSGAVSVIRDRTLRDQRGNGGGGRAAAVRRSGAEARRDVAAWAERGVTPPRSTKYRLVDGQVVLPKRAKQRRGIQPVVDLTVRGGDRITVKAGQRLRFSAKAQVPPRTGKIVSAGWDFTGTGSYLPIDLRRPKSTLKLHGSHRFTEPGTYYVALKVASSRSGRAEPFAQVENLDRVRVVVRP
jgi:hypothetical protein